MKTLGFALLFALLAALPAAAQDGPTCNENHAEGVVQSELATCIAQARQNLDINFATTCACPGTGYSVTVIGTPRCHPGEICPLFAVIVGTAQLDCDFNVISAICGASPPA